jgi:hypothetical protein
MPATGGTARTVYSSSSRAVTAIYAASASTLLLYVETTAGNLSQNGLWKINPDGSGLIRLLAISTLPCQYTVSGYPETQISSNSQTYALLHLDGVNVLVLAGFGII